MIDNNIWKKKLHFAEFNISSIQHEDIELGIKHIIPATDIDRESLPLEMESRLPTPIWQDLY